LGLFFLFPVVTSAQVSEDFEGAVTGWSNQGTPTTGNYVLGNPVGTNFQLEDDHTPGGVNAIYTATNAGGGDGADDVDGGTAILQSPIYNIVTNSTLSIWYFFGQRDNGDDAGDFFLLEFSLDGGASYNPMVSIGDVAINPVWTEATAIIPAGSDVRIRMHAADGNAGGDIIEAGIDDITITPNAPMLIVDDVTVNEGAGTLDFVVTTGGTAASGPFTVNYQTINGSATGGGVDYTSNSGTLNFDGTLNDQETVTVLINDDSDIEPSESFQIIFTFASDSSVDISDTGTGTIDDNDTIIIVDGSTVNQCSGSVFDTGGIFGQYGSNEGITFTVCPDGNGNDININFNSFDVQSFNDMLSVYEGTSTAGTLIGSYHNSNLPPANITSSDPSGCLTFRFTSDGSINGNGWEGIISCIANASALTIDDITVDEDAGTMTFTVEHTGLPTSGPFTVTYSTVDGSATAGNDYTGIVNGLLNFDGAVGDSETITVSINDDTLQELIPENFTIQFTTTSNPSVDITDIATGIINDNEEIPLNEPLTLFNEFNGYYDYAVTGGSLRTSDTDVCAITTSSSNVLTTPVPTTALVERAYLFWTHSGATPDLQVTFEGQTVNASFANQSFFNGPMYSMIGDVTTLVSGIPNLTTNTFDFTDLAVDNGDPYCSGTVVVGGWSLMIFYTDDSLPAVSINLYQGFDGQRNNTTSYTLDGFFAIGDSGAKTTVLSWEGDIGLANNELLSVTTSSGTATLSGDGDNNGTTTNNPFNSTLYDDSGAVVVDETTFGLDLDTHDISAFISAGESTATTNVGVGQDFVMLNAVLLKVPSNLIVGNIFEDINYGGGAGRDLATSGGVGLEGTRVELYDSSNVFQESILSNATGEYSFGGMANGSYSVRVVNNTVNSSRGGGDSCSTCIPVQTYRRDYANGIGFTNIINEVGGADPGSQDVGSGTLTNAQTISSVNIISEGVVELDFGFNFNTIVNTNADGQGSLEQFILNSNALDETGLDIEANSIFDPTTGEDTSIFMIPSTSDLLGRTPDANFTSGYFSINIPNGNPLTAVDGNNTNIDGRTQTAYSGNTNSGMVGAGGTTVGIAANTLPNYELPEIQVYRANGDIFRTEGTLVGIRGLSVYSDRNSGIRIDSGSANIVGNLIGVNALGNDVDDIVYGIEVTGGSGNVIDGNYISANDDAGIYIDGGTATVIQNNHITANGAGSCDDNITINAGAGIIIQQNLIENATSLGIDGDGTSGSILITENTITGSGQDTGSCSGNDEHAGILLDGNNSSISNNIIASNGGPGIVLAGGNTSGNLISRNSIFANGTTADALGIDLDPSDVAGDGVTLNETGDTDNGPNGLMNFPIIEAAYKSGSNVVVSGWSRPGATIEFFLTDVNQGTATLGDNQLGFSVDYGEGQVFLASRVEGSGSDTNSGITFYLDNDGNTDNTNKFTFTFAVPPGITLGDDLTATATVANSTSEFSPFSKLIAFTVITNRRITYRVKKD